MHRDEWYLAAEVRDRHPWDACRVRLPGWDAWGGVRRDVMADECRVRPQKRDVDAGKWAGREQDDRARDD